MGRRGILPRMDSTSLAATRVERFLETEPVVWLSTTGVDGAPHLVPTWFAWDGEAIVIRSKPGARKIRNLRSDPRAMLALGDAEDDFDVGLLEATAEIVVDQDASPELPAPFVAKYGGRIAELGLTPAQFARTYSETIRLTPGRALDWHGRSRPASVIEASARLASLRPLSIAEPPAGAAVVAGEPIARRALDVTWRGTGSWRTWLVAVARSVVHLPRAMAG